MLLVALVSTYAVIMLGLLILFPSAGRLGTVEASSVNQYSSLSLQLSPSSANPGQTVDVSGSLPSPDENVFALEGPECGFGAYQFGAYQSGFVQSPNCVLWGDGSITGSFQVSSLAHPARYSIYVVAVFYNMLPLYSSYSPFSQYCSTSQSMEAMVTISTPVPPVQPTGNSTYNCVFFDSSTLEISSTPGLVTTTISITSYSVLPVTITTTSTTTENITSQLTAPQAIVTVSATAAVTAVATRIYAKRRPGFDVEVRSGIDRKENKG